MRIHNGSAQSRKRKRESDLINDCQSDINAAEEFKYSYLLHGLPEKLISGLILNGMENSRPGGININSNNGTKPGPCTGLCGMLKLCVGYASFCKKRPSVDTGDITKKDLQCPLAPNATGWSRECSCPSDVIRLKAAVMSLLVLEAKAFRWYQGNCAAYIYYVSERLNASFEKNILIAYPAGIVPNVAANSAISLSELICAVDQEVADLQEVLFSIPENDCGMLFLRCLHFLLSVRFKCLGIPGPPKQFGECFKRLGVSRDVMSDRPDLEGDGFEIIEIM